MQLLINNTDYTCALDGAHPLTVERKLNVPSVCEFSLLLPPDHTLAAPQRFHPVSVCGDDGTVYFTGYVTSAPLPGYAGLALEGPRFRTAVRAVSDEILLDLALASAAQRICGLNAGDALAALAARCGNGALSLGSAMLDVAIGELALDAGEAFSKAAGKIASRARATYRAHRGALSLNAIPAAVHSLDEAAGTLSLGKLTLEGRADRDLADDITVCGENEPAAYVTEIFQGDGVTASFNLAAAPYFAARGKSTFLAELFDGTIIDETRWSNPSGSTCFSVGTGGLVMNGGSGLDGQAMLSWLDPVEMGGTLLLEAEGLMLSAASAGLMAAFMPLDLTQPCVAGFQASAQQGTGAVSMQPVVNGAACGSAFAIDSANQYTVRLRVHCAEPIRALAAYRSCGDNGPITIGGQFRSAPARLHFEIQEFVNGVAGMPVTLYEGTVDGLPAACIVAAASSLNLHGSLRALRLGSVGSAWVVSVPPNGSARTRRMGSAAQAAECQVDRAGRLIFYNGFAPAAGEQITVSYRSVARATGRAVNTSTQQALAAQGMPSPVAWTGTVLSPPARTSADCRNAAAALAAAAGSENELLSGAYQCTNFELGSDIWPGDALAVNSPSCSLNAQLVVRGVKLMYRASLPDVFAYDILFANDWAEDLAIRTSQRVPADASLPVPVSPVFAADLNALTVTAISGNTVSVNTGATAPAGGGFEVRTRDHAFMMGEDPSLVVRGSQPNLTFTRPAAADRFYVRMFDAADPPNYSEFSAAVILNLPLGS